MSSRGAFYNKTSWAELRLSPCGDIQKKNENLGMPSKKNYQDREIVPIPSDPPTIDTVSEYLDSEYW